MPTFYIDVFDRQRYDPFYCLTWHDAPETVTVGALLDYICNLQIFRERHLIYLDLFVKEGTDRLKCTDILDSKRKRYHVEIGPQDIKSQARILATLLGLAPHLCTNTMLLRKVTHLTAMLNYKYDKTYSNIAAGAAISWVVMMFGYGSQEKIGPVELMVGGSICILASFAYTKPAGITYHNLLAMKRALLRKCDCFTIGRLKISLASEIVDENYYVEVI